MAERPGRVAAEHLLRRTGYDRTGDDASDRALVRTGVGQHEEAMQPGRGRTNLRLQGGGRAHDAFGPLDAQRYGRGSRRSHGEGRGPKVNIMISAPHHADAGAMGQPMGGPHIWHLPKHVLERSGPSTIYSPTTARIFC